eukprot:scaffold33065_cov18-Tisochrysis_lutea.AAC.1
MRILMLGCASVWVHVLWLAHLGVGQVVTLVGVQRQTKPALDLAQVVPHVIRVLGQIDRLQRQASQPLAPVHGLASHDEELGGD